MKEKSEVSEDSRSHEHRALHNLERHSSSRHYKSTSKKSSSSQIPETPTKERNKRRSSSEEPGKRVAEEKRKKKRKASEEDNYPATKRTSGKEQAVVGRRQRKELVERQYRKSNEKRISEWKSQNQHSSASESKHPASVVTQHIRPKTQGKGHSESINPPTSKDKSSLTTPSLPITFKIPKKSSAVKPQTSTANWEHVKKSPITSKCSPKIIKSSSLKVMPVRTRPRSSPVPSCSPPVQLAQLSRRKETSAPSSSHASVKHVSHAFFCIHKTEQIPLLGNGTHSLQSENRNPKTLASINPSKIYSDNIQTRGWNRPTCYFNLAPSTFNEKNTGKKAVSCKSKPGVTNLFETVSYFMGTGPYEGLPI